MKGGQMKKNLKSKEGLERCPDCGKVSRKHICGCEAREEVSARTRGDPVVELY